MCQWRIMPDYTGFLQQAPVRNFKLSSCWYILDVDCHDIASDVYSLSTKALVSVGHYTLSVDKKLNYSLYRR